MVQQKLVAMAASSGPLKQDSIPFTPAPSAASVIAAFGKAAGEAMARAVDDRNKGDGGRRMSSEARGADVAAEKRKVNVARSFAQILHPDGSGANVYVGFARQLRKIFWRQQGAAAKGAAGDAVGGDGGADEDFSGSEVVGEGDDGGDGGDFGWNSVGQLDGGDGDDAAPIGDGQWAEDGGSSAEKAGRRGDGAKAGQQKKLSRFAKQESRLSDFPPHLRWIMRGAMGRSRSAAEQHNLLNYAKEMAKMDGETYGAQAAAAEKQLERLKKKEDEFSRKRYARTKKLLAAILGDKAKAEKLQEQLERVLGRMQERNGDRIRDGYNLLPKARFVIPSAEGFGGLVSGTDLASVYREEVLCMVNPSQFFENFMLRHGSLGFRVYLDIILRLLGDDIKSANPSRGIGQLQATRDGLFFAEISHQIYLCVIGADQKLRRIRIVTEKEEGAYVPITMGIAYGGKGLEVSVARQNGQPMHVATIPVGDRTDHFAALTELVNGNFVDEIVMANCDGEEGRKLRFAVQRRYGLPMRRSAPLHWKSQGLAPS
jgi:hypothetical protein